MCARVVGGGLARVCLSGLGWVGGWGWGRGVTFGCGAAECVRSGGGDGGVCVCARAKYLTSQCVRVRWVRVASDNRFPVKCVRCVWSGVCVCVCVFVCVCACLSGVCVCGGGRDLKPRLHAAMAESSDSRSWERRRGGG